MLAEQLIYTSWENGESPNKGFMIYSKSTEISDDDAQVITSNMRYEPLSSLPYEPTQDEIKQLFPRNVSFFILPSGKFCLAQSAYIGKHYINGDERMGNYIIHAFVFQKPGDLSPLSFVDFSLFKTTLTEAEQAAASPVPPLPPLEISPRHADLSAEEVYDFFTHARQEILKALLQSVIIAADSENPVYLYDINENLHYWLKALSYCLPLSVCQKITFDTYSFGGRKFKLMCVQPGMVQFNYSQKLAEGKNIFEINGGLIKKDVKVKTYAAAAVRNLMTDPSAAREFSATVNEYLKKKTDIDVAADIIKVSEGDFSGFNKADKSAAPRLAELLNLCTAHKNLSKEKITAFIKELYDAAFTARDDLFLDSFFSEDTRLTAIAATATREKLQNAQIAYDNANDVKFAFFLLSLSVKYPADFEASLLSILENANGYVFSEYAVFAQKNSEAAARFERVQKQNPRVQEFFIRMDINTVQNKKSLTNDELVSFYKTFVLKGHDKEKVFTQKLEKHIAGMSEKAIEQNVSVIYSELKSVSKEPLIADVIKICAERLLAGSMEILYKRLFNDEARNIIFAYKQIAKEFPVPYFIAELGYFFRAACEGNKEHREYLIGKITEKKLFAGVPATDKEINLFVKLSLKDVFNFYFDTLGGGVWTADFEKLHLVNEIFRETARAADFPRTLTQVLSDFCDAESEDKLKAIKALLPILRFCAVSEDAKTAGAFKIAVKDYFKQIKSKNRKAFFDEIRAALKGTTPSAAKRIEEFLAECEESSKGLFAKLFGRD